MRYTGTYVLFAYYEWIQARCSLQHTRLQPDGGCSFRVIKFNWVTALSDKSSIKRLPQTKEVSSAKPPVSNQSRGLHLSAVSPLTSYALILSPAGT